MQKHLKKLTPKEKSTKRLTQEEEIDSEEPLIPAEIKKEKKFFLFGKKNDKQAGG